MRCCDDEHKNMANHSGKFQTVRITNGINLFQVYLVLRYHHAQTFIIRGG